jgi:hypothetical protein
LVERERKKKIVYMHAVRQWDTPVLETHPQTPEFDSLLVPQTPEFDSLLVL